MPSDINKTHDFLLRKFQIDGSESAAMRYRYEHTLRVAGIGRRIALEETLDEETLVIGCLLHDIGYAESHTPADFEWHGRISANISEEFLYHELGWEKERILSVCYGIFAHTEDPKTLSRSLTPLEASITDADNIDRFDAFRLYDNLKHFQLENLTPKQMVTMANQRMERYTSYLDWPCGTATGAKLWNDHIHFQIDYYQRLKRQMENQMTFDETLRNTDSF